MAPPAPTAPIWFGPGFFTDGKARIFRNPLESLSAHTESELEKLFARLEVHLHGGGVAAGYLAFEAGRAWEPSRPPAPRGLCLAWFALFNPESVTEADPWRFDEADGLAALRLDWPRESILPDEAWNAVRSALEEGRSYQVNLTGRVQIETGLPPHRLFPRLLTSQRAPYAAWLPMGPSTLLSLSPELFFRKTAGLIVTQPMKGTAPRGRFLAEDRETGAALLRDEKTLAENRMIVDLLRNDLGRICVAGTVEVPECFVLQPLSTVWQMTSTIQGRLLPGVDLTRIFQALFPCGSVAGAPKLSTLSIIRELEPSPRGPYCGAIGWASAREACFSVAIRTVEHTGGVYSMGVGSGLVEGSSLLEERKEWVHKTDFLLRDPSPFSLFTSLTWDGAQLPRRERHVDRLVSSAAYFAIPLDRSDLDIFIDEEARRLPPGETRRLRIELDALGKLQMCVQALSPPRGKPRVRLADETVDSRDAFLFHKTSRRARWNRWRARAEAEDLADFLFVNERGELTEGTIHSLRAELDGRWITPALRCGLLPGVLRQEGLDAGDMVEGILHPDELRRASRIAIGNALHPWRDVEVVWN